MAAIEILDAGGTDALTFRALAAHLATGAGAIYWHVANKDDLLVAATDDIIGKALADGKHDGRPDDAIRVIALGVFDALDAHPWMGAQFSREPWSAMLEIFESIGGQIQALGVPEHDQFNCASALVNYVLGLAGLYAEGARLAAPVDRTEFLGTVVSRWTQNDPADYPFAHQVAAQLRDHSDRDQFRAGVDLILAGIVHRYRHQ